MLCEHVEPFHAGKCGWPINKFKDYINSFLGESILNIRAIYLGRFKLILGFFYLISPVRNLVSSFVSEAHL
jgi:uncharacterized protein involved in cysteine biosynthesis